MNTRECVPPEELTLFDGLVRFVEKHGEPMITRFEPDSVVDRMGLTGGWDVLRHEFPAAEPESLPGRPDGPAPGWRRCSGFSMCGNGKHPTAP